MKRAVVLLVVTLRYFVHPHRYTFHVPVLLDSHFRLKLADFGLARSLEPPLLDQMESNGTSGNSSMQDLTNKVITLWYRSPEILLGTVHYGCAVDVWSAGCILAELFTGKPLAAGKTELDQLALLAELTGTPDDEDTWRYLTSLKKSRSLHDAITPTAQSWRDARPLPCKLREKYGSGSKHNFPENAITLLEKLLVWDPRKRLTASNALQHKYFWTQPVAPANPAELGQIQVAADGHFHEFQTKQKRRQAKLKAEEVRGQAVLKGVPTDEANDLYDKTYKSIMKQAAEEGLATEVDRKKPVPPNREDEPNSRPTSSSGRRRGDEKRERSPVDRLSRVGSSRDRSKRRDRSPESDHDGGRSKRSRAGDTVEDDPSANSKERRHRSKDDRRRSDDERRRAEKEKRSIRKDNADNESKGTRSRRASLSKRGIEDDNLDRADGARGGSHERRSSKRISKDKKRRKHHKEKGRDSADRRDRSVVGSGGKSRSRDERRRERSSERSRRSDDISGHYGPAGPYGPAGGSWDEPSRLRENPYGPSGPLDDMPPRHRDGPPSRHGDDFPPHRDNRRDGEGPGGDHYGPPRRDMEGKGDHVGPRGDGPNDHYGLQRRDLDGPPRRDLDGPPRRELDGPPRRDLDGPPRRDLDGPPRRDLGPPPPGEFYRDRQHPPEFRGPTPRRSDGPPPYREGGGPPNKQIQQGFRDRNHRPGDNGLGRARDRDRR